MSDLRICVVGAGYLSTKRICPYIGAAGAQLVGVCDLQREKAETNARRFGGRAFTDMEEMLAAVRPDGVMICVGPQGHCALAQKALRMGIPAYIEKPPALSAAEVLRTARLSAETGVLCSVAFKKRYSVAYSRAKEWLGGFAPEDYYSLSIDYASGQWPNDSLARSFIFDFAIHAFDLMPYLFGDVRRVFAFSKGLDAFAVSVEFANGAVGSMNLNDGRGSEIPTEEVEISVRGGNAMSIHNSACWRIAENGRPTEWREPPTFISAGDSGYDTGHLAEIADFFAAIREKRTTRSNIYEAYKSMAFAEAVRTSAQAGQVVEVRYETI